MSSPNEPVMGTVSGFRLVLDEMILEFDTFGAMYAKAGELQEGQLHKAIEREDNGETELSLGASESDEVGDQCVKLFCQCGKSEWFPRRADMAMDFACGSCDDTFGPNTGDSEQRDVEH